VVLRSDKPSQVFASGSCRAGCVGERKLPRSVPSHVFFTVSGCFSALVSCLCLALVADRGSAGWQRDDAVEVRWMAVLLGNAGCRLVMGLGLRLRLELRLRGERRWV
jgi:hypothetical protein